MFNNCNLLNPAWPLDLDMPLLHRPTPHSTLYIVVFAWTLPIFLNKSYLLNIDLLPPADETSDLNSHKPTILKIIAFLLPWGDISEKNFVTPETFLLPSDDVSRVLSVLQSLHESVLKHLSIYLGHNNLVCRWSGLAKHVSTMWAPTAWLFFLQHQVQL
jgi:hypothetical protein